MKLREFFYVLGYKFLGYTHKPRKYPYIIREQVLEGKTIEYAQWLHPKSYDCQIPDHAVQHHRRFLDQGDVAIDIGAHSGDSTMPIAFAIGASGCVLAFEANAYVFDTLKKNSELNRNQTNIVPYNLAVTEENRVYEFSYNDPGFNNGGNTDKTRGFRSGDVFRQLVQGVNLFDFLEQHHADLIPRIRFIKVDAEGYDVFILRSMTRLLDRITPYVQVEVFAETPPEFKQEIFQIFSSRGYRMQDTSGSPELIVSVDEILDRPTWDMHCTPPGAEILTDAIPTSTSPSLKNRAAA